MPWSESNWYSRSQSPVHYHCATGQELQAQNESNAHLPVRSRVFFRLNYAPLCYWINNLRAIHSSFLMFDVVFLLVWRRRSRPLSKKPFPPFHTLSQGDGNRTRKRLSTHQCHKLVQQTNSWLARGRDGRARTSSHRLTWRRSLRLSYIPLIDYRSLRCPIVEDRGQISVSGFWKHSVLNSKICLSNGLGGRIWTSIYTAPNRALCTY